MTEVTPTLEELADGIIDACKLETGSRGTIVAGLRDAYELGAMSKPEPAPATRTAFGQPSNPEQRAGLVAQVVHTIPPEKIAEHGEDALLAYLRQSLRELAQHGADPFRDASIQVVGMGDGTVVVTGEARV